MIDRVDFRIEKFAYRSTRFPVKTVEKLTLSIFKNSQNLRTERNQINWMRHPNKIHKYPIYLHFFLYIPLLRVDFKMFIFNTIGKFLLRNAESMDLSVKLKNVPIFLRPFPASNQDWLMNICLKSNSSFQDSTFSVSFGSFSIWEFEILLLTFLWNGLLRRVRNSVTQARCQMWCLKLRFQVDLA